MGGVSAGRISRAVMAQKLAVRMEGEVSLENNGGFLQIALDLAPDGGAIDASGFAGLAVSLLGNGEQYGIRLRTASLQLPVLSETDAERLAAAEGLVTHLTDRPPTSGPV